MTDSAVVLVYNEVMPDGNDLPRETCREFRRQLEAAVPWLPPDVNCEIRDLVTPQFWLPKSKFMRRKLGRLLAYWVANGELDLGFVPGRSTNKRYRRRTTP